MPDKPTRPHEADGRQARLRDALRENLKRRKSQARGRAAPAERGIVGEPQDHPANSGPASGDAAIVQDTRRDPPDDVI